MNKMLTVIAISITALLASNITLASPNNDHRRFDSSRDDGPYAKRGYDRDDDDRYEKRRPREENGVKRLQQMHWQQGYVMPQHYRGNSYKVEYKQFNLPKPTRNQQWYKVNKDYLLVDADNNNIIRIVSH
jgi:Ni/Co efflux regulator RcnB